MKKARVPFKLTEFNEDIIYQINRNFEDLLNDIKSAHKKQDEVIMPYLDNLSDLDVRNYAKNTRADQGMLGWQEHGNVGSGGAADMRYGKSGDNYFTLNPGAGLLAYIEQEIEDIDNRDNYYLSMYYGSGALTKGPGASFKATLTLEYTDGSTDEFEMDMVI